MYYMYICILQLPVAQLDVEEETADEVFEVRELFSCVDLAIRIHIHQSIIYILYMY